MSYLVLSSMLFAFSFGLIKRHLGDADPTLVAALRMAFAAVLFLPFLRKQPVLSPRVHVLMALGALQYGVMYLAYLRGFRTLEAHQVALLTLTTPLYVALVEDLKEWTFHPRVYVAAFLAVVASVVVVGVQRETWPTFLGVMWVQASNLAFALGQVLYRSARLRAAGSRPTEAGHALADLQAMAWLYVGAAIITSVMAWATVQPQHLTSRQWAVVAYLGLVPSGLGFFLWNAGAARVSVDLLAPMNNLKIPFAVLASFLIFGERPQWIRLTVAAALFALALFLTQQPRGGARGDAQTRHREG